MPAKASPPPRSIASNKPVNLPTIRTIDADGTVGADIDFALVARTFELQVIERSVRMDA
jgi:hypothetical protein